MNNALSYLDALYIAYATAEATGSRGIANFYLYLIHLELGK